MINRMEAHSDRARSFALHSVGIAAVLIALSALLFAVSWRQHYGPCRAAGTRGLTYSLTCVKP
jgi:hypothetical protein